MIYENGQKNGKRAEYATKIENKPGQSSLTDLFPFFYKVKYRYILREADQLTSAAVPMQVYYKSF